MALREQTYAIPESREPVFTRVLTRAYLLNWEMIAYTIIFVLAVLTRFVDLGARVMSHDESLHTYYSWRLYEFGEFSHTPLMHGPVIFHMVAFSYWLFGDNDFTARLYPAVLGVLLVMFPILLRRWLGRVGAVITSVLLLISPMVMYYNRYIREDTPSVFFTVVMVYALLQYVDGDRPRRPFWLYLMSAALLLTLASKEVAFMYIAIFGSFLVLYWLMRMVQDIGIERHPAENRTWHAPPLQVVLGHLILLGLAAVVAFLSGEFIRFALSANQWLPSAVWFQLPIFLVLYLPLALSGAIRSALAKEPRQGVAGAIMQGLSNGKSAFRIVIAGVIIGAFMALLIVCLLDIIKPSSIWVETPVRSGYDTAYGSNMSKEYASSISLDSDNLTRLVTWIGIPTLLVLLVIFLTAVFKFPGHLPLPWREILLIILIALVSTSLLVAFERRSYVEEKDITPFAAMVSTESETVQDGYNNKVLNITWAIMIGLTVLVAATRLFTPLWDFLNRQPIFDTLIVIGTLAFPWLSAFPVYWAGYDLEHYDTLPGTVGAATVDAGIQMLLAFGLVSVAVGLSWNWKRWLPAAAIFVGLFAFFFTTVFSNKLGVITGAVGSLGYWLEQQEVRRGSQPQYYYVLTQLPMYEFLPMIGALLAGITGLSSLWRWRREQVELARRTAIEAPADNGDRASEAAVDDPLENLPPPPAVTVVSSTNRTEAIPLPPEDGPSDRQDAPAKRPRLLRPYDPAEEAAHRAASREWIGDVPFLALVGYWAIMILLALTMAGEKMPWLTIHLTVPLILATGWWLGQVFNEVPWRRLGEGGWLVLLVALPLVFLGLVQVILPLWGTNKPFQGRSTAELTETMQWLLALLILFGALYLVGRFGRRLGLAQIGRLAILAGAVLLGLLTARAAFMASFINYDYATEFLVYAHSGPAVKTVMNEIDRIAELTNQGTNMRIVFDDESSWPYTWYLRHYTNYGYLRGEAGSVNAGDLENAQVIIVGSKKAGDVRKFVGDRYYEFSYFRLWWPMQDYFGLLPQEITDFFSNDKYNVAADYYRDGVFDIWWERDYSTYAQAQCIKGQQETCKDQANLIQDEAERERQIEQCQMNIVMSCRNDQRFSVANWPVSDRMYVFINKSTAAQVWDAGIGSTTVDIREPSYPEDQVYRDITVERIFGDTAGLNGPRGIAIDEDGFVYVTDMNNNRIVVFDPQGNVARIIGAQPGGTDEDGSLVQPWGVDVADGYVYVADTWNNRVQVFTTEGEFVRKWGHLGTLPEDTSNDAFWGPREIKVGPDGNVYVADTGGKRIRVYQPDGTFVRDIGGPGAALGQLDEPVGLAFNPVSGHLYVAEPWNQRVQTFDPATGMSLGTFTVNMWFNNRNSYNRPYLTVSPDGTLIYVTDMDDRHRVVAYNLNGTPILSFNQPDDLAANVLGVRSPAGLAFDEAGRLYVVDAELGRIVVFPPAGVRGDIAPAPAQGLNVPENAPQGAESGDAIISALEPLPVGYNNRDWTPIVRDFNGVPMVYVPAGCFNIGADNTTGSAGTEVCLSAFWISRLEITQAQYAQCVSAGGCIPPTDAAYYSDPAFANAPVVSLTWDQAMDYAEWLGGTLPTDAQWEYAARGPSGWLYPWGEQPPSCDLANYVGCGGLQAVGISERADGASWVGALDMAGSVAEWTLDWASDDPYAALEPGALDPTGPASGEERVARGNSYNEPAAFTVTTYRTHRDPGTGYQTVGIRVVIPALEPDGADVLPEETAESSDLTAEATPEATETAAG